MNLDIRLPIGLLFASLGGLLVAFGLLSDPALYARSLGINVNLGWGLVMLGFGGLMAFFGRRGRPRKGPAGAGPTAGHPLD